jgi:hypothetical protein
MISLKNHKWATLAKRAQHTLARQKSIIIKQSYRFQLREEPNIIMLFAYLQNNIETNPFHYSTVLYYSVICIQVFSYYSWYISYLPPSFEPGNWSTVEVLKSESSSTNKMLVYCMSGRVKVLKSMFTLRKMLIFMVALIFTDYWHGFDSICRAWMHRRI